MSLGSIRKGPRAAPDRILLMGVEGVGKSSFAAAAPNPIFIASEDGIRHLDVASFPQPETFRDARAAVQLLAKEAHDYRTLVVDTLDWLEPLCWAQVCRANGWESVETPGYGKGFVPVLDLWREFVNDLDALRGAKGMEILLLAHTQIRAFENPAGPNYSRFECKLHKGAAALLREWADVCLFATYEDQVVDAKGREQTDVAKRGKAVSSGRRVMYTQRTAAWDAKNRLGLPFVLPLDYGEFDAARKAGQPASPAALEAEARELLGKWAPDDATRAKAEAALAKAAGHAAALAKVVDRLRSKVAEKEGS